MIVLLILAVVVGYFVVCTVIGFAPATDRLAAFDPEVGPTVRAFDQSPDEVLKAYHSAASRTPGMVVRESAGDSLLIDLRPTIRIMDGNFGLAIRVRAAPVNTGTRVTTDARNKVRLALLANHSAALIHAERALRMNAKRQTLTEIVLDPSH